MDLGGSVVTQVGGVNRISLALSCRVQRNLPPASHPCSWRVFIPLKRMRLYFFFLLLLFGAPGGKGVWGPLRVLANFSVWKCARRGSMASMAASMATI